MALRPTIKYSNIRDIVVARDTGRIPVELTESYKSNPDDYIAKKGSYISEYTSLTEHLGTDITDIFGYDLSKAAGNKIIKPSDDLAIPAAQIMWFTAKGAYVTDHIYDITDIKKSEIRTKPADASDLDTFLTMYENGLIYAAENERAVIANCLYNSPLAKIEQHDKLKERIEKAQKVSHHIDLLSKISVKNGK